MKHSPEVRAQMLELQAEHLRLELEVIQYRILQAEWGAKLIKARAAGNAPELYDVMLALLEITTNLDTALEAASKLQTIHIAEKFGVVPHYILVTVHHQRTAIDNFARNVIGEGISRSQFKAGSRKFHKNKPTVKAA